MIGVANNTVRHGLPPTFDWQGPDYDGINALPYVSNIVTADVFVPTSEGVLTYNFHPQLHRTADGRCHLMHTQHNVYEEGKGSYVVYRYSDNEGSTWSAAVTIMPGMETYAEATYSGPRALSVGWVGIDGILYALMSCVSGVSAGRAGKGLLAVPVSAGVGGTPVLIHPAQVTPEAGFPEYLFDAALAGKIVAELNLPYSLAWNWCLDDVIEATPVAGTGTLNEYSKIRVAGGHLVFARGSATGSDGVMWSAFSPDGVTMGEWSATTVPSAAKTMVTKMPDGRYVMILNKDSTRLRTYFAQSEDGLTWLMANCYRLITSSGETAATWAAVGKAGGAAYHSKPAVLDNGDYLIAYGTRGKEVIRVTRFTPPSMV